MSVPPVYILVGPENPQRLIDIHNHTAPQLDYRLIAQQMNGIIKPCIPAPMTLKGPKFYRLWYSLLGNFLVSLQIVHSLPKQSIIYSTGETWGLPMSLALRFLRRFDCTHVVYLHRVYSHAWQKLLKTIESIMHVDGWICVTQYQAHLLQRLFTRKQAITVVSQGVDTQFFQPNAHPQDRGQYILSVGSEMRNYPLLMAAVAQLDFPVWIKASSAWMTNLRDEIRVIPKNVTLLTKYMSYIELRRLYEEALFVVVPLHNTPQAAGITTILEAMAMAKTVVATKSNGNPDVLVHSENGLVVEPSAQALSSTLKNLLMSNEQRELFASSARKAVCLHTSLDIHAEQIHQFILDISCQGNQVV